jgi:hypothetical protein
MKTYEALLEEPATAESPFGDACSECGEPLGTEFVYEMADNDTVIRAYHKTCERKE